ncbi:P-loop containing nucleoside triphosphate hydrolase protein [Trametes elegans]|nr:P-loop containing nucleoside triphosphate hydrolase protein [Trametes elegans]
MAASLWTKSLALFPAARVCRCSHALAALQSIRAGRTSSVRFTSSSSKALPETLRHDLAEATSAAEEQTTLPHADQPKFETLQGTVSPELLRALMYTPFRLDHMSPVQAAVASRIPTLLQSHEGAIGPRDLLVKARTGTGKTLAFLIPAVEARYRRLRDVGAQAANELGKTKYALIARAVDQYAENNVGVLIVSPTRELATQIANEAIKLTRHLHQFQVRLLVGGLPKGRQYREWIAGRLDIVVATPGRLRDFIMTEPEVVEGLRSTNTFILDEADTLLDMGFREDIEAITQELRPSPQRQTFMFSATVSKAIQQIAKKTLAQDFEFINCVPHDSPPTHLAIPQFYTALPGPSELIPHVLRLIAEDQLTNPGKSKVLVFFSTTKMVQLYSSLLGRIGRRVLPAGHSMRYAELHSQKSMPYRVKTSDWFRKDTSGAAVLFTSDVSARGVDYPGITRVIQIGIPSSPDGYIHRVGRTGRGANMKGRTDLVLMPWETSFLSGRMSDIPLKELTTKELKQSVTELAQAYDSETAVVARDATIPPGVERRLGHMADAIAAAQVKLDENEVRDALIAVRAFYEANHPDLRGMRDAVTSGVREWASVTLGQPVDLPAPRQRSRGGHRSDSVPGTFRRALGRSARNDGGRRRSGDYAQHLRQFVDRSPPTSYSREERSQSGSTFRGDRHREERQPWGERSSRGERSSYGGKGGYRRSSGRNAEEE